MEYFFQCPNEFFKSMLVKADKPASPSMALMTVISKVAFGCYRVRGDNDTTVEIRPGQFPVDVDRLRLMTGWRTKKMTDFLHFLVDNNVLDRKVKHGVTVATFNPDALVDLPPYERYKKN